MPPTNAYALIHTANTEAGEPVGAARNVSNKPAENTAFGHRFASSRPPTINARPTAAPDNAVRSGRGG